MKKIRVYLRIGDTPRKYKVSANTSPNHEPIWTTSYGSAGNRLYHPTVAFALDIVLPDDAFAKAKQSLGEVVIPDDALDVAIDVPKMATGEDPTLLESA